MIGVAVVFAAQIVAAIGGTGLALIIQMAALVVATWVFAFAPVIAVTEHRRLMDCLGRSVRAARLPGSGNLTFAAVYVVPIFATFLSPGLPGVLLDVSPPFTAWIYVRPDESAARGDRGGVRAPIPRGRRARSRTRRSEQLPRANGRAATGAGASRVRGPLSAHRRW